MVDTPLNGQFDEVPGIWIGESTCSDLCIVDTLYSGRGQQSDHSEPLKVDKIRNKNIGSGLFSFFVYILHRSCC